MATYVYRCSECDNIIDKNVETCPFCNGLVTGEEARIKANIIGFGKVEFIKYLKVRKNNIKEQQVLNNIISKLNNKDLIIQKNSDNYTTLCYKGFNLARMYVNSKTKIIKLLLTSNDKKKYIDDPLFSIQSNKKEVLWSSLYSDNNIDTYIKLIQNKIEEIDK